MSLGTEHRDLPIKSPRLSLQLFLRRLHLPHDSAPIARIIVLLDHLQAAHLKEELPQLALLVNMAIALEDDRAFGGIEDATHRLELSFSPVLQDGIKGIGVSP